MEAGGVFRGVSYMACCYFSKILVLSYTSSNNQLKLLSVIFGFLILKLRDFVVHYYLKRKNEM